MKGPSFENRSPKITISLLQLWFTMIKNITIVYNLTKHLSAINCKKEINKTDMKMLCPSLLILVFHLLKRLLKIPSPKRTKNRMDRAAATIKNRGTAYIRFCK